jgi:hypothetical protein
MTSITDSLEIAEIEEKRLPKIVHREYPNWPGDLVDHIRVKIRPAKVRYLLTLTLNTGGNLYAPGLKGNCGIRATITVNGGIMAEDIDFNYPSSSVTFRASCAYNKFVISGEEVHVDATAKPYGVNAEENLESVFARLTLSLIPSA